MTMVKVTLTWSVHTFLWLLAKVWQCNRVVYGCNLRYSCKSDSSDFSKIFEEFQFLLDKSSNVLILLCT